MAQETQPRKGKIEGDASNPDLLAYRSWIDTTTNDVDLGQLKVADDDQVADDIRLIKIVVILTKHSFVVHHESKNDAICDAIKFLKPFKISGLKPKDIGNGKKVLSVFSQIHEHILQQKLAEIGQRGPNALAVLKSWITWMLQSMIEINNFTTDSAWTSGRALCALVNRFSPGHCTDWDKIRPGEKEKKIQNAINIAFIALNVPKILTTNDLKRNHINETRLLLYLGGFIHLARGKEKEKSDARNVPSSSGSRQSLQRKVAANTDEDDGHVPGDYTSLTEDEESLPSTEKGFDDDRQSREGSSASNNERHKTVQGHEDDKHSRKSSRSSNYEQRRNSGFDDDRQSGEGSSEQRHKTVQRHEDDRHSRKSSRSSNYEQRRYSANSVTNDIQPRYDSLIGFDDPRDEEGFWRQIPGQEENKKIFQHFTITGRLAIKKPIGSAGFGVSMAQMHDFNRERGLEWVCAKGVEVGTDIKTVKKFIEEAILLFGMKHENVVPFLGVIFKTGIPYIVMPLVKDTLQNYLQEHKATLSMKEQILICLHVARGMKYLAALDYVHRDLALDNCLVVDHKDSIVVKIGELGFARDGEYAGTAAQGSHHYKNIDPRLINPELFNSNEPEPITHSEKTDVFSFGTLLWGVYSFGDEPIPQFKLVGDVITFWRDIKKLDKPDGTPDVMYDLMVQCWGTKDRPSFKSIVRTIETIQQTSKATSMGKMD